MSLLIDYYASWYEGTSSKVELESGEVVTLHRLGLGRRYHFDRIGAKMGQAALDERAELLLQLFNTAGVEGVDELSLADLLNVAREITALNRVKGRPPWELVSDDGEEPAQDPLLDYEGRKLARVVHVLAKHYGWSVGEILNLPPEVAQAHLQECILSAHSDREWDWFLSQISWEYDKRSGKSRHRKMNPLRWAAVSPLKAGPPIPDHVRERLMPTGVIIDLTEPRTRSTESDTADNETPGEGATAAAVP